MASRRREFEHGESMAIGLLGRRQRPMPIDPEAIAAELGVKSVRSAEMLEDGKLTWDEVGEPCIEFNARRPRSRQRFTIAHEIAHLLISRDAKDSFRSLATRSNDEEALCDAFAGALLMPRSWIEQVVQTWHGGQVDLNLLRYVSHHAAVSMSAAAVRITEVSGTTCALLRWQRTVSGWICTYQAAVPPSFHGRVRLDETAIAQIESSGIRRTTALVLALQFDGRPITVDAQVDRDERGVLMLIRSFEV